MDRGLRKLIALQLGLTLIAAGLCAIREVDWAVSALAGGGIGTAATGAAAVCITRIKRGSPGTLLGAQIEAAQRVVAQGLSVREAERLVRRLQEAKPADERPPKDPNIAALEHQISERLGAKTSVRHDGHGRGSVVIYYTSLDELDGILNHIK